MRALLRRLAEMEPTALPVLSIYLDMRPHASGESSTRRISLTILRDRLSNIEGTLGLQGEAPGNGQVDLLLLDAAAELDDDHRNDLIRLAATTVPISRSSKGIRASVCSAGWEPCSATGWTDRRPAAARDAGRPSQPRTRLTERVLLATPRQSAR